MPVTFIGQIKIFAGDYAPEGWLICDGSMVSAGHYHQLYDVIGNTYGGDENVFGLPDFRGRVAIHEASNRPLASSGGSEQVSLTEAHLPIHRHDLLATNSIGNDASPAGDVPAQSNTFDPYSTEEPAALTMAAPSLRVTGGGAAHENRQPYICMSYIIATDGDYPH